MIGSPLTDLQRRSNSLPSTRDMSVGYPRLTEFTEQWARFADLTRHLDQPTSREEVVEQLRITVAQLLGLPPNLQQAITFSGSIALERTIGALVPPDRETVVTVPGFDSIYSFVRQASGRHPIFLESDPFGDRSSQVQRIQETITASVGAVILVSPNNPTGLTLSPAELRSIAETCSNTDTVLIVDHCFALVDPWDYLSGSVFDMGETCRWAGLWDSSKTVELLGEKFGMISGSQREMQMIEEKIGEIQLDLPLGSLAIIRAELSSLTMDNGLAEHNRLVRENYTTLSATCAELELGINRPDAGSFALVEVGKAGLSPRQLFERLAIEGLITVVPAEVLYPVGWRRKADFVRVSLMRPRELVGEFCEALRGLL